MRVLKFGGTSVAEAVALRRVIGIINAERGARVVVVSALAGVTDALFELGRLAGRDLAAAEGGIDALVERHHEIARTVTQPDRARLLAAGLDGIARSARTTLATIHQAAAPRPSAALTDRLVATGELWSSRLLAALLEDTGLPVRWADARDVVRTDGQHQRATADLEATTEAIDRHVRPSLAFERVVVLGGYVGSGPDGATTTLGRGGSDYSAAIVGACLSADEIQIWTDVDGVFTADPRVIPHARPLATLSYDEAHDLATFGAKVLHPATIQPAAQRGIPVRVLNSHRPEAPGTWIGPSRAADGNVTAVAFREQVTLVEVIATDARAREPFAAAIFRELARRNVPVVVADLCGNRLSVAVDGSADLDGFEASVSAFASVRVREGLAAVCAVGRGWPSEPQLIRYALSVLDDTPLHVLARPSATSPLALIVDAAHARATMQRLHDGLVDAAAAPIEACA